MTSKHWPEAITELRVAADIADQRTGKSKMAEFTPNRIRGLARSIQELYNQALVQKGVIEHLEKRNAELLTHKDQLAQCLWDIRGILGFDNDGDPSPGATIAGMGIDGFIAMILREVAVERSDYSSACDEIARREYILRKMVEAYYQSDNWEVIGKTIQDAKGDLGPLIQQAYEILTT